MAVWVRARAAASFGAWPRHARHQTPDQRPTAFGVDAIFPFVFAGELSRRGAGGGAPLQPLVVNVLRESAGRPRLVQTSLTVRGICYNGAENQAGQAC